MNKYVECTNFKMASLNNNENFAIAEYGNFQIIIPAFLSPTLPKFKILDDAIIKI